MRPVVRRLYRLALSGEKVRVIYQNDDDRDSFVEWGLVDKGRTRVIRGSGVDLNKFRGGAWRVARGEGRDDRGVKRGTRDATVKILFASRLLREKGVFELVEAFSVCQGKIPSD